MMIQIGEIFQSQAFSGFLGNDILGSTGFGEEDIAGKNLWRYFVAMVVLPYSVAGNRKHNILWLLHKQIASGGYNPEWWGGDEEGPVRKEVRVTVTVCPATDGTVAENWWCNQITLPSSASE